MKNPKITPRTVGGPNKMKNYMSDGESRGGKQTPDARARGAVSETRKNKK